MGNPKWSDENTITIRADEETVELLVESALPGLTFRPNDSFPEGSFVHIGPASDSGRRLSIRPAKRTD